MAKKKKINKVWPYGKITPSGIPVRHTNGYLAFNDAMFNKMHGTDNLGGGACGGDCGSDAGCGDSGSGECGGGMAESMIKLKEAKREVRRYYLKPQSIWCANKAEVLKALIDIGTNDCVIYTLANLVDNDDVQKLSDRDVIYYYEDGILYDKNHVRVMDYDLVIKHEENRPKLADNASDATFRAAYEDRITDQTVVEDLNKEEGNNMNDIKNTEIVESEDEALFLEFDAVNAYGETLKEDKNSKGTCCICGETFVGYGNNPAPYKTSGRCCDACNLKFVIPARYDEYVNSGYEDELPDDDEFDEALKTGNFSKIIKETIENPDEVTADNLFIAADKGETAISDAASENDIDETSIPEEPYIPSEEDITALNELGEIELTDEEKAEIEELVKGQVVFTDEE